MLYGAPIANGKNQTSLLCQGNEFARHYHSADGVLPADQRFNTRDAGTFQLGLIVMQKFALFNRPAKVMLHRRAGKNSSLQGWDKEVNIVAAGRLGLILGNVRLLQNLIGGIGRISEYGHSHAGRATESHAIQLVRPAQRNKNLVSHILGVRSNLFRVLAQV